MAVILNNFKRKFVLLWKERYLKISFLLNIVVILYFLDRIPYINLIFTPTINLVVLLILFSQLFKLQEMTVFRIIVVLFMVAGILQVIGLPSIAEQIGDWIYFAALYGLGMIMVSLLKKAK